MVDPFHTEDSLSTTMPHHILYKIPQEPYALWRQQNFQPSQSITFSVNGSLGVNMGDIRRKCFKGLDGRDDPVLQGALGAITCRLKVRRS